MRRTSLLHTLCLATLAAVSIPAQAIKLIDPLLQDLGPGPAAEPKHPCQGSFYQRIDRDAQHDQIGGLPMHDFYEFYTSESVRELAFTFYVTDNTTIAPVQSRYEVRFTAGDSTDTYFVRVDTRGKRDVNGLLVGDFQYGLYSGRPDGLGSREVVVKRIADPGYFYANGSGVEYGGVIDFSISKAELEALAPSVQGFNLGQKLNRLQAFSFSAGSLLQPADQTRLGSYRLRLDQGCPR